MAKAKAKCEMCKKPMELADIRDTADGEKWGCYDCVVAYNETEHGKKEHPDCEYYQPFGALQTYAMEVRANVCTENVPYSCRRSQEEGLCKKKGDA